MDRGGFSLNDLPEAELRYSFCFASAPLLSTR